MSDSVRAPHDDDAPVPDTQANTESPADSVERNFWIRRLYTQNPFYLLSVCFVLHGTSYWFQQGDMSRNPWPLMAVVIGYILLLAATSFVLVKYGNVWDDARSIFLLLPVMFVELSLTFDDILISNQRLGTALLIAGFTVSSIVIEALLIGLRMKMPTVYRIPIHAMLALLFLYPVFVVSGSFPHNDESVAWKIYLFAPLASLALLSLLPAIRKGPAILQNNGTPWNWPLYPWSLMTFLGIGLAVRSYALGLSFDPISTDPNNLQGTFGLYFMAPMTLALAAMFLEAGIARQRKYLSFLGMILPVAAIYLSINDGYGAMAQTRFLRMFTTTVGSPLYVSLIAAAMFYGVAFIRQIKCSEELAVAALLCLCCVDPETQQFTKHFEITIWPLFAIVIVQIVASFHSRPSSRTLRAMLGLNVLAWSYCSNWPLDERVYVFGYSTTLTLVFVSVAFRDEFARNLRFWVSCVIVLCCVSEPFVGHVLGRQDFSMTSLLHQSQLVVLSIICAYGVGSMSYFRSSICCSAILLSNATFQYAMFVIAARNAYALGVVSIGFAWFVLAAGISATKARWLQRAWALIPRPKQPDS